MCLVYASRGYLELVLRSEDILSFTFLALGGEWSSRPEQLDEGRFSDNLPQATAMVALDDVPSSTVSSASSGPPDDLPNTCELVFAWAPHSSRHDSPSPWFDCASNYEPCAPMESK